VQTKLGSLIEAAANIVVGFSVNWGANMIILPHYDCRHLTALMAFEMGLWFTIISLIRSYVIRRYFNGLHFFHHKVQP
jgi:hypothetical protein